MSRIHKWDPTTGSSIGEPHLDAYQRNWGFDGSRDGMMMFHAAGEVETGVLTSGVAYRNFYYNFLDVGLPTLIQRLGGDKWGNATTLTDTGWTYAKSTLGASASGVVLIGTSMGGINAMNWARLNASIVKCMVLVCPVSDLLAFYNTNGNYHASINAAYGGAYNDATDGPNHSPVQFGAQLSNIPIHLSYATDDTVVTPDTVLHLISVIGSANLSVHTLTGGHNNLKDFDYAGAQAFVQAHL